MDKKKIIVVFGATGAQGGGLVRAILNDAGSEFAVRAVTRDTTSDRAKELANMGAEVVSADVDDAASVKSVLANAYGAYFVTFFWSHFSPEKESEQVQIMAEAAKEAGLKHVIWSTLEDTRKWVPLSDNSMPTLHGKYKVPHFDGKGQSDHFFTDAGVPTTFLLASYYWENLIYFGMGPKKGMDGKYYITFPMGDKKMAGIGSEDIGKCAYGIFKKGPSLAGKHIGISGGQITCREMAQELSSALGKEVHYNEVTPEQYRGFGFPGADDLGNMFQFYRDYADVCNTTRDVSFSRELNPSLKSFTAWLSENKNRIPVE
jgi:uncharacterized protein YbjT (DUF2867 family)